MSNRNGTPANLIPAHPANRSREVHGFYSARSPELGPEGEAIVGAVLALPHVSEADFLIVERLAGLVVSLRRIEHALADGRVENRYGRSRDLLDVQRRLSGEVRELCDRLGLTPAARAGWLRRRDGDVVGDQLREAIRDGSLSGPHARRALLEAIAFGPETGTGERLRALEQLGAFDVGHVEPFVSELEGMSEEELDRDLDELLVPVFDGGEAIMADAGSKEPSHPLGAILADAFGAGERFPGLKDAIQAEIDARARRIAG